MADQHTTTTTTASTPLKSPIKPETTPSPTDIDINADTDSDTNSNADAVTADTSLEEKYVPVDIMVYGKAYTVNCPVGEESQLKQGGKEINKFVQSLRLQAPHLSREDLLLLCCLDMYETLENTKKKLSQNEQDEKRAFELVNKILADAESML